MVEVWVRQMDFLERSSERGDQLRRLRSSSALASMLSEIGFWHIIKFFLQEKFDFDIDVATT